MNPLNNLISDLRSLDRHNIGVWPGSVKIFFMVLAFVLIVFLGWYFRVSSQQSDLAAAQHQEVQLRQEFQSKHAKAANLGTLKKDLAAMNKSLSTMLHELPSKTEMSSLLSSISGAAQSSGIVNNLFRPDPEISEGFYAIQPITVQMRGTYNQFGAFVSSVASMSRMVILTVHDVSLKAATPPKTPDGPPLDNELILDGQIRTYRYVNHNSVPGVPHNKVTGKPQSNAGNNNE